MGTNLSCRGASPFDRSEGANGILGVRNVAVPIPNEHVPVYLDHSCRRAKSGALILPPTTCTSGRIATETNSDGWTLGLLDTFTRTSCGAPAFGPIHTTNGRPVLFGDKFAVSQRPLVAGAATTNSIKLFISGFIPQLAGPAKPLAPHRKLARKNPAMKANSRYAASAPPADRR
jgi:hypothetical protein